MISKPPKKPPTPYKDRNPPPHLEKKGAKKKGGEKVAIARPWAPAGGGQEYAVAPPHLPLKK